MFCIMCEVIYCIQVVIYLSIDCAIFSYGDHNAFIFFPENWNDGQIQVWDDIFGKFLLFSYLIKVLAFKLHIIDVKTHKL